jgi:RNA polymerase sigma-70 factor, ECF subfamily
MVPAGSAAITLPAVDEVTILALSAAAGDRMALHRLIRATQAEVWRFCAHLGDPDCADDLTQEVYLRAMKALPRFRGDASVRTWLLAIARRTVADDIRAQQRRRRLVASTPPADRATSSADEHVVLRAVVDQLPDDRREAFVLTQLLGLSYAETALVCRCPIGTVRSRVARARADLVAAMGEQGEDGLPATDGNL